MKFIKYILFIFINEHSYDEFNKDKLFNLFIFIFEIF